MKPNATAPAATVRETDPGHLLTSADHRRQRTIFYIVFAAIAVLCLAITPRYGLSGDEFTQHEYGKLVWNYFKTGGEDKSAVEGKTLESTQSYYGGLFDGMAAAIEDTFHPRDIYLVRHYMNVCFGLLCLLFTGLLAKQHRSWRTAIMTLILLCCIPRFFGEMFNNPKDIPFAATYVMGLYVIFNWLSRGAARKWKHTIALGLVLALGLSIRIGGLLLVAYLGLFWLVQTVRSKDYSRFSTDILHMAVAVVVGYLGCSLAWPYAMEDPFGGPLEAMKVMSSYPLTVRMLFEGRQVTSTELPASYELKMLFITTPILHLLLFLASWALPFLRRSRAELPRFWMLLFAAVFPVAYIVFKHAVVYDGIRHILFVLPLIALCAAIALDFFLSYFAQKAAARYALLGLSLLLLFSPLRFAVAAHPYQYLYFNETVGGLKGAYGHYETDYYLTSVKEAYDWFVKNRGAEIAADKDTIMLVSNALSPINASYIPVSGAKLKLDYSRYYEQNKKEWDYAIYFNRFLDRQQLQNGYFPSGKSVYVVKADGVPICAVLQNDPERNGRRGYQALEAGDAASAVAYLRKAVAKYPKDMESWSQLASASAALMDTATMRQAIGKVMEISAIDINTSSNLGDMALQTGAFDLADRLYGALQAEYPDDIQGSLGLAKSQAMRGDLAGAQLRVAGAIERLQEKVDRQGEQPVAQDLANLAACHQLAAGLYQAAGDRNGAQQAAAQAQNYMQQAQQAAEK